MRRGATSRGTKVPFLAEGPHRPRSDAATWVVAEYMDALSDDALPSTLRARVSAGHRSGGALRHEHVERCLLRLRAQNKLPGPAPASVADAQHHGFDHGAVTSTEMAEALAALEDSSLTVLMPLTVAAWGWRT